MHRFRLHGTRHELTYNKVCTGYNFCLKREEKSARVHRKLGEVLKCELGGGSSGQLQPIRWAFLVIGHLQRHLDLGDVNEFNDT